MVFWFVTLPRIEKLEHLLGPSTSCCLCEKLLFKLRLKSETAILTALMDGKDIFSDERLGNVVHER